MKAVAKKHQRLNAEQRENISKLGIKVTDEMSVAKALRILRKKKSFKQIIKLTNISSPRRWEPIIKQAPWSVR